MMMKVGQVQQQTELDKVLVKAITFKYLNLLTIFIGDFDGLNRRKNKGDS